MTRFISKQFALATLMLLAALWPAQASDGRRRAVGSPPPAAIISPTPTPAPTPPPPSPDVPVTMIGEVMDRVTGRPVVRADVYLPQEQKVTRTDAEGRFRLSGQAGRQIILTIGRTGYETSTFSISMSAGTVRFMIVPLPTVTVRTVTGRTYELDMESVEFGYVVAFVGYTKDREIRMCRPDGRPFTPDRDQMRRIVGPAVPSWNVQCCPNLQVTGVTVEMKTGERTQAFFVDSCFGYSMNVVGIDHVTADAVDVKFSEVAEIVFP